MRGRDILLTVAALLGILLLTGYQNGSAGLTLSITSNPATLPAAGEKVTLSYLVTNTGSISLHISNLTDTLGTVNCPASSLEPGAKMTCTLVHQVSAAQAQAGIFRSNATVYAYYEQEACCGSETHTLEASAKLEVTGINLQPTPTFTPSRTPTHTPTPTPTSTPTFTPTFTPTATSTALVPAGPNAIFTKLSGPSGSLNFCQNTYKVLIEDPDGINPGKVKLEYKIYDEGGNQISSGAVSMNLVSGNIYSVTTIINTAPPSGSEGVDTVRYRFTELDLTGTYENSSWYSFKDYENCR